MLYLDRLKYSAAASLLVHLVILTAAGYQMSTETIGITPQRDPIVLNLSPRVEPEEVVEEDPRERELQRLIDPGAAAEDAVSDTDLISSQDSEAQSQSASDGDPDKPAVDRLDEFDEMGRRPSPQPQEPLQTAVAPPQPRQPEPTPEPEPEPEHEPQPEPEPAAEPEPDLEPVERVPDEQGAMQIARVPDAPRQPEPSPARQPNPEPRPEPSAEPQEPTQVAQAAPPPVQELRATRGREDGGAQPGGFTSFEAKQHELGAYMLEVRNHVEREWRTALATRYAGVGRAVAVLDCSIRPDGTLEYVRIVDGGNSPGFATLCKASVERAARHFPPFPFEVPDIYRSKNLEVRWQFTYM